MPAAATTTARGLYDAVLIKENHSALAAACGRPRARRWPARPRACAWRWSARRSIRWTRRWPPGATSILLDNMDPTRCATPWRTRRQGGDRGLGRRHAGDRAGVAETGVDWISVGALTHSAPALDVSLLMNRLDRRKAEPLDFRSAKQLAAVRASFRHLARFETCSPFRWPPRAPRRRTCRLEEIARAKGRGACARRGAQRGDPRPQLPGAGGPGRGPLRGRLARPLAPGGRRPTPT